MAPTRVALADRGRRLATVVVALAVLAMGLVLSPSRTEAVTPAATPYPPPACSSVSVDRTLVTFGETVLVTGHGYGPHVRVRLVLDPTSRNLLLAVVVTNASGGFSRSVVFPNVGPGRHLIYGIGPSNVRACPADPFAFVTGVEPISTSTAPGGGGGGSGTGGLGNTGVDIAAGVGLAACLIAVGLLLTRGARARRRAPAHRI